MSHFRAVDASIDMLRCANCGKEYPHAVFTGEFDTSTDLLGTATSCEYNEVVIAEMTREEWDPYPDDIGRQLFEVRLAQDLNRTDLHVLKLLRIERHDPPLGLSPKEFRRQYVPPVAVYACPCCGQGESTETIEITPAEFQRRGGRITVVGPLKVLTNEGGPDSFVN